MNSSVLAILKSMIPILEPIGEEGVAQLFDAIDAEVAKMGNGDFKDAATIFSPALKAFAILELKKLKVT